MLYTNEPQITSGTRLQSNYDLNKANTSGWYTAVTPKNGVSGLNTEKLFVIAPKNKNYITQFAFGDNDNLESMWFRSCANGTWSEWKEVATTDLYLAIAGGTITGDLTVKGNINGKFTGTPTTPNATGSSSDQQIANLKYVNDSIAKLVNYSPTALDTLKELADAIGNDPNFAATMTSKLSEKFDKVGGQITGDVNVTGKIIGHLVGNADTATRAVTAATADKTQAAISFKDTNGNNVSFNGNTAVDMTGGVYYAKESSHTVNADEATHAASATTVNAIAETGQARDLVSGNMATSDAFRIRIGDTGEDNGYVEIATADNGSEPIYVRQYTLYSETFANIVHQVTLLDGNGNTSFPGTIWAPTFSGHLAGTADNATNATHASNADNALYASVANRTDNSISFKNTNGNNVSFNGNTAIDLTGGVYYAKEATHAANADNATHADTCNGNAATTTSAAKLGRDGNPGNPMTFNWSGQSGQPSWLWGGNDGTNMYVWNPSNFSVAHAANADNATHAGTADNATNASHASNADNATHSNATNHTDNSISFKDTNGNNVSFNGAGVVDLTGGVYYAKEATHAANANEATHANNADNATHAGTADNATHAGTADNATNASHASNADSAGGLSGNIQLKYETNENGKKAINAYVDGNKVPVASQSNISNGYIIKCGVIPGSNYGVDEDRTSTIIFDQPFPHACLGVCVTQSYYGHGSIVNLAVPSFSTTQFAVKGNAALWTDAYYIAFGY